MTTPHGGGGRDKRRLDWLEANQAGIARDENSLCCITNEERAAGISVDDLVEEV